MVISIAAKGFRLTAALLNYTQERVKQRLGRTGVKAKRVQVILSDTNGSRGGEDKRCQVLLDIAGRGQLAAQAIHNDMYGAIDQSLAKAKRRVVQVSKRRQSGRHSDRYRDHGPMVPAEFS
ncbi:MAG: HPF/RaiA family ribosome-associated protein [Lysobacterales bacterium]